MNWTAYCIRRLSDCVRWVHTIHSDWLICPPVTMRNNFSILNVPLITGASVSARPGLRGRAPERESRDLNFELSRPL